MADRGRALRTSLLLQRLRRAFELAPPIAEAPLPFALPEGRFEKAVVIAPHPDDEVIGCGGLIQSCVRGGTEVVVAFLTVEAQRSIVKPSQRDGLDRRTAESIDAQRVLGYHRREHLDSPELGLAAEGPAARALCERIRRRLEAHDPDLVVVPNHFESHPDHAAASTATLEAIAEARRAGGLRRLSRILVYEIWGPCRMNTFLSLSPEVVAAQERALGCYRSQLASVDYHAVMSFIHTFRADDLRRHARRPAEGRAAHRVEAYELLAGDAVVDRYLEAIREAVGRAH